MHPTGAAAGTITGGPKSHAGRTWDHVFDVELDSGAKLKLAMDAHENPYIVADRFLAENDLPAEFREQIVQFVIQNTGSSAGPGPAADLPITGGFCDPFTGGAGGPAANPAAAAPPPRPAFAPPAAFSVTGGGVDPFTGGGGGGGPAAAAAPPALAYLLFDAPPPAEGLGKKLREFSAALRAGGGEDAAALALTAEEEALGGPLDKLLQRLPAFAAGAAGPLPDADRALLSRLLQWPAPQLFPALDIARCIALDPAAAAALAAPGALGSLRAPAAGTVAGALAAAAVGAAPAARQTALRLAANLFKHPALRGWALAEREALLDGFAGCGRPDAGGSKAIRLGLATLLLNYCVAASDASTPLASDAEGRMQLLSGLEDLVVNGLGQSGGDEGDAAARALAGLAALTQRDAGLAAVARDLGLGAEAARLGAAGGPKAAAAAADVARALAG